LLQSTAIKPAIAKCKDLPSSLCHEPINIATHGLSNAQFNSLLSSSYKLAQIASEELAPLPVDDYGNSRATWFHQHTY